MTQKSVCLLAIFGTLNLASPSDADTRWTMGLGALSEDSLGKRAAFGSFGLDGLTFQVRSSRGPVELSATFGADIRGKEQAVALFDAGLRFGDGAWKAGVGKIDRHWSPSRFSSLILSHNTTAFPTVYISKSEATPSTAAWFSWLGPWRGDFFLGQTSDPGQPGKALFAGMQFVFEPTKGLEIALQRSVQFGGAGRSNSLTALLSGTNEGAAAAANQLAGVSLSYALPNEPIRIYTQVMGEDEAGGLPSCLFYLAGMETQLDLFGIPSTLTLETVDTRVGKTRGGNCGPNTAFNNSVYPYVHQGDEIGAIIGSEGRSVDLRVSHSFTNWQLDWRIGHYEINAASDPDHRLSSGRADGAILSIGARANAFGGEFFGVAVYQGFALDRADIPRGIQVGLGFSKSF